ncbi:RDD family protein [Anatilimnocola floriformis]|uniref:RDD family protein n=1 Tax=Anatilimnocola floriformis TaxID=2948575 RepID=UPI0020C44170|nr:RDD family protein [Anatilimnocola floriformis]
MAQRHEQIDSIIRVVTPENIAFEYRLAGPFRRLPALLIDWTITATAIFICAIAIAITFGAFISGGLAEAMISISFFVFRWFYGGLFETFMNGQTPGKRLTGIRVLTTEGQPINGLQAIMRNLFRGADLFLPLPCLGLLVMTLNKRSQRLGDLVSGTIVVVEQNSWLTGVAKLEDPRAIQLAGYLPPNFIVSRPLARALATYVERRRFFSPLRRREVAKHLGEPLLVQFGLPADTSYDLLLCALYYRTFIADRGEDERRLAEATAAAAQVNPFSQPFATPAQFNYKPPPLPQEQMVTIPATPPRQF